MKYLVSGIMSSKEVVKKKIKKKKKWYLGSLSVPAVYCFASPMASSSVRLMAELVCSKESQVAWYLLPGHLCSPPPPSPCLFFLLLPLAFSNTLYTLYPAVCPSSPRCLCPWSHPGQAMPTHHWGKGEEPTPWAHAMGPCESLA